MTFPKTMALLQNVDLGHPTREVSPHGLNMIGYLTRASETDNTEVVFRPWPAEVDPRPIFSTYIQELAEFDIQRSTAVEESRIATWIEELASYCAQISREHGFHEREDELRGELEQLQAEYDSYDDEVPQSVAEMLQASKDAYVDYISNRLLLIVSEVTEAHDELRSGHEPDEVYYNADKPTKPEGFLSEVIDVLVRGFDLLGAMKLAHQGGKMFVEKTNYNGTRPFKHGRKF